MKRVLLLFLLVIPAFGQFGNATRIQSRPVDPAAPSDTNVICWDAAIAKWKPCTAGGSSAPADASFVVMGLNGTLTNERVATAGSGVTVTDGGAGGNVTFAADTAIMQSLANDQSEVPKRCVSATGNDTYTCALTPTLTAYTPNQCITLRAGTLNTGAASLNIDTLGALPILTRALATPANGDIPANVPTQLCADATGAAGAAANWILQTNPATSSLSFASVTPGTNTGSLVCGSGCAISTSGGQVFANQYQNFNVCTSAASPAVCGASNGGSVNIAAGATTVVVNTSLVNTSSQINLTFDSSKGATLGVTCNTTFAAPWVSAIVGSTSFTISVGAAPVTNPACYTFSIIGL